MVDVSKIREHMEVIGSDDQRVGTVDRVENERIKLTRRDPEAGGVHHYIPMEWVDTVETNVVKLNKLSGEAQAEWTEAEDNQMSARKGI